MHAQTLAMMLLGTRACVFECVLYVCTGNGDTQMET